MSCNGCRVLRKGCNENCILRPCLQWIESPEAQAHATVFVAKFFGRAGLMSFISSVPESQSAGLFRSLLYEACGRTVNPVNGAVGLLWTGKWNVCEAAVATVLRGGSLRPIPEVFTSGGGIAGFPSSNSDEASEICTEMLNFQQDESADRNIYHHCRFSRSRSTVSPPKRKRLGVESHQQQQQPLSELDFSLIPTFSIKTSSFKEDTFSIYSEESIITASFGNNAAGDRFTRSGGGETAKLLDLFA